LFLGSSGRLPVFVLSLSGDEPEHDATFTMKLMNASGPPLASMSKEIPNAQIRKEHFL
jgi:hypothetical protein